MLRSPYCLIKLRWKTSGWGQAFGRFVQNEYFGTVQQRSGYADAAFVSFGKSFAFPVDDFVQLQLLGQGYQIVHKILMADPAQTGP